MTSGRSGGRSVRAGTTGVGEKLVAGPFGAVLEAERRWLTEVSRAEDLTGWRSRVIGQVMDRESVYAQALRRDHGACRQNEFFQDWQLLLTRTLERIAQSGSVQAGGPATAPVTTKTEDMATAILAALHGGAILSWLADDPRSLEAALDIALAPVLSPQRPSRSEVQPPR